MLIYFFMHSNVKYQIFTMEKTSSQTFLREYYFAISKIKLPQEFHATRYLSIKLITLRVPVLLFSSISSSESSSRGSSRSGFYYQRLTLESWLINLEQTPLNRSQQLSPPYKRLIDEIKQNYLRENDWRTEFD